MMEQLDPDTHDDILGWSADGDALAKEGKYADALECYFAAWKLLPEPQNQWETATWLAAAIGDAGFLGGYLTTGREALEYGVTCPDGLGNPFIHLRLGQILFEQGDQDRAADELMRAYMGAGDEIFASEDTKYQAFLATRANLSSQ